MLLFLVHQLLLGNFRIPPYKNYRLVYPYQSVVFYISESEQSHFGADPVFCRPDEKQPLCQKVWYEYEIMSARNRLHKLVPGENEVRKDEEDSTEGEETAPLQHRGYEHSADEYGIDADPYLHNTLRNLRGDPCENNAQKGYGTEDDHRKISYRLSGQLMIRLDFPEIPSDEIYDEPYVSQCKETHLREKIAARSEVVAECGEEQCETHLPGAQPQ